MLVTSLVVLVKSLSEDFGVTALEHNSHATQKILEGTVGACIFTFLTKSLNQVDGLVTKSTIRVHDEWNKTIIGFSILGLLLALDLVDGVEGSACRLSDIAVAGWVGYRHIHTNRRVRELDEQVNDLLCFLPLQRE